MTFKRRKRVNFTQRSRELIPSLCQTASQRSTDHSVKFARWRPHVVVPPSHTEFYGLKWIGPLLRQLLDWSVVFAGLTIVSKHRQIHRPRFIKISIALACSYKLHSVIPGLFASASKNRMSHRFYVHRIEQLPDDVVLLTVIGLLCVRYFQNVMSQMWSSQVKKWPSATGAALDIRHAITSLQSGLSVASVCVTVTLFGPCTNRYSPNNYKTDCIFT